MCVTCVVCMLLYCFDPVWLNHVRRTNKKNKQLMVIHYKDRKGQWKVSGPRTRRRHILASRKGGPAMTKSAVYPDGYGIEVQRLHQEWKEVRS